MTFVLLWLRSERVLLASLKVSVGLDHAVKLLTNGHLLSTFATAAVPKFSSNSTFSFWNCTSTLGVGVATVAPGFSVQLPDSMVSAVRLLAVTFTGEGVGLASKESRFVDREFPLSFRSH